MSVAVVRFLPTLLLLLFWTTTVHAAGASQTQSSPPLGAPPFPASGGWSNPAEPGSGFMLEVQGGVMAGGWFGYSALGDAEWRLFSGALELRSASDRSVWALVATTYSFAGGACFGCTHVAPNPVTRETVELEFTGSNVGRYRVVGTPEASSWKSIQSINFGTNITVVPTDLSKNYIAPVPSGSWVFVFEQIAFPLFGRQPGSRTYTVECWANESRLPECFVAEAYPAELLIVGKIECELATNVLESMCEVSGLDFEPDSYRIPLRDFGDSRIGGLSADGKTRLHGFRLKYD